MSPGEFFELMKRWHPELMPQHFGSMTIKQGVDEIAHKVGFPRPAPGDLMSKVLDDLWLFI